jgi:hypothetical protein
LNSSLCIAPTRYNSELKTRTYVVIPEVLQVIQFCFFLQNTNQSEMMLTDRRDELVQKVRCIIQDFGKEENLLPGMKTVDALERLGVGYHFEQEISTFMDVLNRKPAVGDDLCAVALQFRLLRQHHYDATCGVYNLFHLHPCLYLVVIMLQGSSSKFHLFLSLLANTPSDSKL